MAGAGYRTFAVGEVLTASNVQSYLMDQSVMRFADSGARGSAIGTATEGMVSYLDDTDAVEVYDGSAWTAVGSDPNPGIGSNLVHATKTDTFSYASSGFQDVTGLSVTITPSSSASKVLIMYQIAVGASTSGDVDVRLTRGTAVVGSQSLDSNDYTASQPGAASGGLTIGAFNYLDSPATTSAITYQVQTNRRFAGTQYVNRNGSNDRFSVSSITAVEVAG